MRNKRIRVIPKERRALDVGKFVLAVVGLAEARAGAEQLELPLEDRRETASASAQAPTAAPPPGTGRSDRQLSLPLDGASVEEEDAL